LPPNRACAPQQAKHSGACLAFRARLMLRLEL
jgi:hypothetical protein